MPTAEPGAKPDRCPLSPASSPPVAPPRNRTRRTGAIPLCCLAFLLLHALVGSAQTEQGALTVVITDPSGAVVPGAAVTLEAVADTRERRGVSGPDGRQTFMEIEPGAYVLTVRAPRFEASVSAVDVAAGQVTTAALTVTPQGVREDVVVTATRIATPVSSIPNTVTIVPSRAIEQRVALSDDLASVLGSNVPGFAPSLKKMTGRGETLRGRNPLYTINGVPQHIPLRDGERDGHTIDLDFVDRIEVIHGASAIQGIGATGGIVNLVTKAPRADGRFTQDVRLRVGNGDSLDSRGWTSKASYLAGKDFGRVALMAGIAVSDRGLYFDAHDRPVGLYPTQGDIMDTGSRGLYGTASVELPRERTLDVTVAHFTLARHGEYVAKPGDRRAGRVATTVAGDPRPAVGDPAANRALTMSAQFRDRDILGGDGVLQVYAQRSRALFEGGAFGTFALTVGGPPYLDQSAITSNKAGAKLTWSGRQPIVLGLLPAFGLDVSQDRSAQSLARTGRVWVPPTEFQEAAPFLQVQRVFLGRALASAGARVEFARVVVNDFTTLPSSKSTFVAGGRPAFTTVLPNAGLVVPLADRLSAYGSFSEGFTMPDVGRVLRAVNVPGQDVDQLVDIEPVLANNLEGGIEYEDGERRLRGSLYRSTSARGSLLERDADNVYHVRRQRTAIHGLDIAGDWAIGDAATLGAVYSWIVGRYDSNADGRPDTDLDGLNIAPNRLNMFADTRLPGALSARVEVARLFARTFQGRATIPGHDFSGYTTVDLSIGRETRIGTWRLAIENLMNRDSITYFSQVDPLAANDTYFAGEGRAFTLTWQRRF